MTQEEFYIWILNYDSDSEIELPEFNPEFLKNYEIAKLVLDKIGFNQLNKFQEKNLNLEAASAWFSVSWFIKLEYDIPEILELLPERIGGDLDLSISQIQSLPKLKSVGGWLNLYGSQTQSLPHLESVEGGLYLQNSKIQSLPHLESVGGYLNLQNSKIQSLPQLKTAGGLLNLINSQIQSLPELEFIEGEIAVSSNKVDYWTNYFQETERPHLAERVIE